MKASVDYVKRKFDEFNRLCFDGKLKPLPVRLSSARTFLGQLQYRKDQLPDGQWHFYDFELRISTLIDRPENVVEDTILHEMIHYYIRSNQIQELTSHGATFIKIMKDINVRFNRNITVRHEGTKEESDGDTQVRQHWFCVLKFRNGQYGITVSTKSRLFQLWDDFAQMSSVTSAKWYTTLDPYFNRYPRSTSAKCFVVTDYEELEIHLADAKELERVGNVIRVKK